MFVLMELHPGLYGIALVSNAALQQKHPGSLSGHTLLCQWAGYSSGGRTGHLLIRRFVV